jgi:hypothetical protein
MPICHTDRGMTLWVSFNRVNKNYLLLISSFFFVYMIDTLIYRKIIQILGSDTYFFIDYLLDHNKKGTDNNI